MLTESSAKVPVHGRDGGQAIEGGADVADFAAVEAARPQSEGLGPMEVVVTFEGYLGHYRPTEQSEGDAG